MHLELVTLHGKILDRNVYQVTIPTERGPMAVYPSHKALVSLAVPGVMTVRVNQDDGDEKLEYFAVSGGVVKINHTSVLILVDEAENDSDIHEAETKVALEKAKLMKDNAKDQVELDKAHELIDRHAVRLKVAELRRKRR